MDLSTAQRVLQEFLIKQEGSTLRAWIHKLDPDHEHRVTEMYFLRYMREHMFAYDVGELYQALDLDGGGELTLEEIDPRADQLFDRFRSWCCENFPGGLDDCLTRMARQGDVKVEAVKINLFHFEADLVANGWKHGSEEELFYAISADQKHVVANDMRWLNLDMRRFKRKLKAKEQAMHETKIRAIKRGAKDPRENLADFKRFLRQKHGGSLLRAWRQSLVEGDSMMLHKGQFFKACVNLKWRTDVKGLWELLDTDSSGTIGIEELDFKAAEELALFRQFVMQKFGNATRTFAALDLDGNKNVSDVEFMQALKEFGYEQRDKHLFHALDRHGKKKINLEDILFLDSWKPMEFLLASPNPEAAQLFKLRLREKFGTFLRAWKMLLDQDGSNTCTWEEFRHTCKKIGFRQDIAGAWRALDQKMQGTISLSDIDPNSSTVLLDFRTWAMEEFGSVRSMFAVFDEDGSKSLSLKEFKRACRIYGFRGFLKGLFNILDGTGSGQLSVEEIVFLDRWATQTEADIDRASESMSHLPSIKADSTPEDLAALGPGMSVAKSLEAGSWKDGDLHPAFRTWANCRRRRPVKKQDGSLPPLASQLDFGDARVVRRPVLLMAYVPEEVACELQSARLPKIRRQAREAGGWRTAR
ncbi:unnamed protein product [Symbiodinium natans]|uniref:EF-hand domain-containing protein n=1 Tax=Symbiodinium natans TaxID=878477 RepID=A0A812SXE3_9DINO|nr:unnamed protein product [Symbiodinium natans]